MATEAPSTEHQEAPSSISNWMKNLPTIEPGEEAVKPDTKVKEEEAPPKSPAVGAEKKASEPTTSTGTIESASAKTATDSGKSTPEVAKDADEEKYPRTGDDWDKFKAKRREEREKLQAEIKAREAKLAEYDGKLKTLESELQTVKEKSGGLAPEIQSEIERLKKENDEYSNRLAATEVTSHPKFIAYFEGKVNDQMEKVKRLVGPELGEEMTKALLMQDSEFKQLRLQELLGDLTPLQQVRVGGVIDALEEIEREKSSEIAKSRENRQKMLAEQQATGQKKVDEGKKLFSEVVRTMQDSKNGLAVYQMRDGDEAWNSRVKKTIADAEKVLFGGPDQKTQDVVKAALHAAAFPVILQSYMEDLKTRDAKIASLEAQVKELSAAQPKLGSGAPPATGETAPTQKVDKSMSPMQASAAWVKSLQPTD